MTTSTSFAQMANNQSISLSSALRANTPPTKGQTTSRKFLTLSIFFRLLLVMFLTLTVSATAWGQYTKASSIAVGDVVVLVYESGKKELSSISGYGEGTSYNGTPAGLYELTVEAGSSSGTFSLKNGNNYLSWSSGNSLATNGTKNANTSWTITFSSGNAIIKNAKDASRQLQWNASSPRFACYTSSQTAVQLYKKVISKTLSSISILGQTTTFKVGDTFKFGGTVTATYSDKSTEDVTSSATFTGYNMSIAGQQTVTVSYEGKSVTYKITVSEPAKHKVYFYNGTTLLNAGGTEFAEGAAVSYSGSTPTSCDRESVTFVGWATDTWDGKVAKGDIVPDFYNIIDGEDLPKMGTADVNYYAVFATKTTTTGGTTTTPTIATLSFASKDQRTTYTTSQQVWEQNGITLTNDKGSSTSNVGDYSNPARFYKSSKITLSFTYAMTQIVFTCSSSDYATDLKNSIKSGATVTASGSTVTAELAEPATSFVISSLSGQVRMNSVEVTYESSTQGAQTTTYSDYITSCTKETTYSVTYNANGATSGYVPEDNTVYAKDAQVTVLGNTGNLAKTGYTFSGWNTKDDGTGTTYAVGVKFKITENTTLYAKWTANTYTITLNANGGTINEGNVETYTYGVGATLPTNVTKENYQFGGWFDNSNCTGTAVTTISTTATDNKVYWAKWTPAAYAINYKDQGGANFSGTHEEGYPKTHTYNATTNLKSASKEHYTFGGWYKENDCSGTPVTTLGATEYTENITLYAQWTAKTYTITLDANGGTFVDKRDSQTKGSATFDYIYGTYATYSDAPNLTEYYTDLKCDGYQFDKWVSGGSPWNKLFTSTGNRTITAQWSKLYTITLSENGTTTTPTTQTSTSYTLPTILSAGTCQDDTKELVGWSTVAIPNPGDKPTSDFYELGETVTLTEDQTTFYAVFATPEGGGTENVEATLSFASTAQRTSWSTSQQVWEQNGITFTHDKASGDNIVNNYGPIRCYKNSKITITHTSNEITKIVFDCNSNEYATALKNSIGTIDGVAVSISSDKVTVSFTNAVESLPLTLSSGQVRLDGITVTTGGGTTTSYSDYTTTCVEVQKYEVTYTKGDGATGTAPTESPKAEGTEFTLASADGLTKDGYSFAGWLCNHDSKTYNAGEEYTMPAEAVTFTAQWNELPTYTVTFYNKGKKHFEVAQTIANAPIECPTGLVACDGYTFAGWSTKELDGVSTFSKIEGEYTPTENITLYAVYAEGNATTNGWVKVTDLSTITEGTYALLSNNNYAFNGTINNNSDGEHTTNSFVFNGEGVASEAPSGTCEIELIASGDGFKMYSEGKGYLYAKANKSGNLAWQQNENSFWSWDSTKDNWVYAEKEAFLRSYNNTFRTYGANNGNAIYFAKKNVTSFTTSPACDPMITIGSEAPVMVTSAKDIRVDAVQNITISATNLDQNADKAQVSIKIVSNNSAFKFKEVDANGDGQVTLTWTGIANATFDKTLCVTYTPTEAGQEETATLTVTAYRHNGSAEYATATMQVRGRSLPEQFVLVANTTDGWVALPNTLGTGSSSSIPYPIAVEVDNNANPTSIPQAPSTTIYKAAARSSVNDVPTGLRFTTEAGGYLQASTSETNIWLSSNNSENMQSWTLNSTDFVDYSIRVNNSAEGAYLNYNTTQKKIGNYKSDNKLRILPVGAVCEQHAAPENINVVSVSANAATIQWDAVATATLGYEYRIGATGEWTKVGNVTELELTKLSSLTNYIVYVRASVEGTNTNCSYESEAEFTTLNCDDVPYDIHYASGANSVTIYWTCEAATSTISLYHDKEGLSLVETKTSVTSPCQFTSLDKFTTYYVQIQAGGFCPSGMIQVSTEQLDLDVVEWMSDGVVVDVNTDETITVTLENEVQYGSGVGQVAEELFFSKYFEGSGNLKLLAIYNGTGKDVDLSTYSIKLARNGNATNISKTYDLSQLGTIKRGQEVIFYTKPSSGEYPYTCSQSFLASKMKESGIDANPRWILCDNAAHNGITYETLDFNGDDPLLLYKGNTLIDVFGVSTAAEQPSKKTQCEGRSEASWSAAEVTNMDYGKTEVDFEDGNVPEGVDLLNPTITAYTARVIMFRKNTVLSGSNAVAENKTDFVTLASEWEVRTVCKDGDDGNLTCGAYQELGKFNYADYYTKYETMEGEQVFDENDRLDDGTIKIGIPNLSTYSCMNIKFNIKVGGVTVNEVTKVPILIADEQSTNGGEVFANLKTTLGTKIVNGSEVTIQPLDDEQLIEKCETCDIVVLANGKLTHETDGIDQFRDLTIYPEGTFHNNDNISVDRLLVHAKRDEVGCAIIENEGVTLTTNAIAHTKRIDAQYWYPFSLPYNCNIADITQANGESLGTYGVHWGIQYYDGRKRQESGTSAGIGQSSNFWTPIYNSNEQLKAYQGYMIALFDASVSSPTEMRTIYFPPVSAQMYTESGTDSKETTITSWNVNLEAEKRHHGWNFTGSPYISVFNPQATGLSEDRGLFSEVLIVSGHYDQGSNEYLYDDEYVYVSIPSPNGAKYYDQYITSATSLKPFTAYFVQAIDPTSGNDETQTLAYAKAGRELPSSAPRRSSSTRQRVLVELGVTAPDGQTDNTGIWVDEKYTSAYEIAADLTKMYVAGDRPQLYTMAADNEKMAYNALPDEMAGNVQLGLYAPTAGSYTFFINERVSRLKGVERVDLLYNNVVVADLLSSAYVIDVPKKGAVNGYTISVCRKANVTTAIDNISGQPINIITGDGYLTLEGIVSDAQVSVYDMLGRLVAAQNANDETNIRIPFIVQGVYNVVVKNEQGMTTIKVVLR